MSYSILFGAAGTRSEIDRLIFHYCHLPELTNILSETRCEVDHITTIFVDLVIALALLYFVITYILLLVKLKGYRKQPYTFVQVGLVYNTLQVCSPLHPLM